MSSSPTGAAIRDIEHQRCIFYIKGRYAIVCDRVLGEGEHQVDLLFHPAPVLTGEGVHKKSRAVKLEIQAGGAVVTQEREHANVALLPAQTDSIEVLDLVGQKSPVRGWFALYGIVPSHDIVYRSRTELPWHFETVVQPLPAGIAGPMRARSLDVKARDGKTCAGVAYGDDVFLISYDGRADMALDDLRFTGTALLLTRDERGRALQAYMVDGTALAIGERQVLTADAPKAARTLDLR